MSKRAAVGRPGAEDHTAVLDRYGALQELAELELELAGRGEIDELESLGQRWQALVAELPERPPRAARALLERAALTHERARIELLRMREAVLAELSTVGQASRAAHGYAPPSRRRSMLDQRA